MRKRKEHLKTIGMGGIGKYPTCPSSRLRKKKEENFLDDPIPTALTSPIFLFPLPPTHTLPQ